MKIRVTEQPNRFEICIEPETMQEANQLVRFGMHTTKKLICFSTSAYKEGAFQTFITIGRHQRATSTIPKTR